MTTTTRDDDDLEMDSQAYEEYLKEVADAVEESMNPDNLPYNYLISFRTYHPIDLQKDIAAKVPIRVEVRDYFEVDCDTVDQALVARIHGFFNVYYGDMVITSAEGNEGGFSNFDYFKKNVIGNREVSFL